MLWPTICHSIEQFSKFRSEKFCVMMFHFSLNTQQSWYWLFHCAPFILVFSCGEQRFYFLLCTDWRCELYPFCFPIFFLLSAFECENPHAYCYTIRKIWIHFKFQPESSNQFCISLFYSNKISDYIRTNLKTFATKLKLRSFKWICFWDKITFFNRIYWEKKIQYP